MDLKILVPSGIGDFSWLWSKLVTTKHNFHIEYIGGYPDRQRAFMELLPKDRIVSFKPNTDFRTRWNDDGELVCLPVNPRGVLMPKAAKLSALENGSQAFIECNSHVEAGNRIESWLADEIPGCNFHYPIAGSFPRPSKADYFVVNFSSYGTKRAWGYYEPVESARVVEFVSIITGWTPLFVGGEYDDYTEDVHAVLNLKGIKCFSVVGRTPELKSVIALIQQSRMYFGACSGLMVLANIFHVPVITYYPKFDRPPGRKLSGTWHDPEVPHLGLFWEGAERDKEIIEKFCHCAWIV